MSGLSPLAQSIIGLGAAAGGIVFLVQGWRSFAGARASRHWPTTQGWVVSSELVDSDFDSGTGYRPRIVYAYLVGTREYTSELIAFGSENFYTDRKPAKRRVERHPPGSMVLVHYDPADPERAVLDAGLRWQTFIPLVFALLFFGVGGFFALR